ncbi:MAG: coiled-coil domain-containing protein [Nostoc sp. DedVER02]|uniref:coiled-coil domain-containing protein n=1 Tax=unclassified Nostoc TaxID=2593658 RepID=UPI002AD3CC53|nr:MULTISPECIES: hypothetical protein [unclassified Nostoc]MDZ7986913.1 hypothetical protein [Nostoc sp. DedVER02]MDZ8115815.1 hypothetical protein [Nostoc sp. DedVER01b]
MSPNHSLDQVIKKVNSSYKASSSAESIVTINNRTRKFEPRPRFWQDIEYYLVRDIRNPTNVNECKNLLSKISDFTSGRSIELSIDYIASCNQENAIKVAEALHSENLYPIDLLEQKIRAIVSEFAQRITDEFFSNPSNCFENIRLLQSQISQRILNEVRLNLNTKISIIDASQFTPFVIETKNLVYTISDFSSGVSLDLIIDYRASCSSESVGQAIIALYSENTPVTELNRRIEAWIAAIPESRIPQIIENFDIEIDNLKQFLREEAKKEIRMTLELRLSTNDRRVRIASNKLKPYDTESIRFPVRVKDYDQELDIELIVTLDVDPARQEQAVKNFGKEILLIPLIKEEVKKYFLQKSLHEFYSKLQNSIHTEIVGVLNHAVADQGRKVGYLSIATKSIDEIRERLSLKEFVEIEDYYINCNVKGYDQPINVKNILRLEVENVALYSQAFTSSLIPLDERGKPDLEKWVKIRLETIVKSVLFEWNYVDLLIEFEPQTQNQATETSSQINSQGIIESSQVNQKIQTTMQTEAKSIGYSVMQIISIPELEQFRYKGNFTVNTGEQEYATRSANLRVALDTVAIVRIDNLKTIKDRLRKSEVSLEAQMKDTIHDAVSRYLNGIDPERFHMSFNVEREAKTETVESVIIKLVKLELEQNFAATVISIIPKVAHTPFLQFYGDLQGKLGDFKFNFLPANHDGEQVICKGKFEVVEVGDNDWNKFYARFRSKLDYREKYLQGIIKLNSDKIRLMQQPDSADDVADIQQQISKMELEAYGLGDIQNAIQDDFTRILRRSDIDAFRSNNTDQWIELENYLNQRVKLNAPGSIKALLGLIVNISQVDWEILKSDNSPTSKLPKIASLQERLETVNQQIAITNTLLLQATKIRDREEKEELQNELDELYVQQDKLQDEIEKKVQEARYLPKTEKSPTFNLPKSSSVIQDKQEESLPEASNNIQQSEVNDVSTSQYMKSAKPPSKA